MNRMLTNEASTVGTTNTTTPEQAETSIRETMLALMEDHINNSFNNPTGVLSNDSSPRPSPTHIEENTDSTKQLDSGVQGCRDHSFLLCSKVIEDMSCDNITLSVHCPLSCNTCKSSHSTNCQDLSSIVCAFVTGPDQCNAISFNKPMKEHCPRSCGECDKFRTDSYALGVNVIDLPPSNKLSNTKLAALKYWSSFGIACVGIISLVTLILLYKKRRTSDENKTPHKRRNKKFTRENIASCSSLHRKHDSKNEDTDTVDALDGICLRDSTDGNIEKSFSRYEDTSIQPTSTCDASSSSEYSSAYKTYFQGPKESQSMLQDDKKGNLEASFSQDSDFRRPTNKRNQGSSSYSTISNATNTERKNISHDLGASNFLPVEIANARNSAQLNLHNVERQTTSHNRDDSFSSCKSDTEHGSLNRSMSYYFYEVLEYLCF